ncbi:hypothetical protein AVT69_gp047 [Pseudomonas phage PhiPA3]|uniref:Uncharacterized protein 046 n=1 Tax=Pseudomonas phage PhiPA3 TaxID=998086 RepID=F8SJS8_BPPA3|nr:hypothetical protein AVT69_gp047 [Pseudomonas phage PhiPA3]AEH03473.1 hypothetical protein [Pseudomonas phage PhiPA3]
MAIDIQTVPIGTKISFELYPSSQYGNNFQNVTLAATMDSRLAQKLGFDPIAAHQNVWPSLPSGVPNDATQYNYFQVDFDNGSSQILGIPWIRADSLTIHNGKTLTLVFEDIDETRKDRIIKAVKAQNENPSSVTFV